MMSMADAPTPLCTRTEIADIESRDHCFKNNPVSVRWFAVIYTSLVLKIVDRSYSSHAIDFILHPASKGLSFQVVKDS